MPGNLLRQHLRRLRLPMRPWRIDPLRQRLRRRRHQSANQPRQQPLRQRPPMRRLFQLMCLAHQSALARNYLLVRCIAASSGCVPAQALPNISRRIGHIAPTLHLHRTKHEGQQHRHRKIQHQRRHRRIHRISPRPKTQADAADTPNSSAPAPSPSPSRSPSPPPTPQTAPTDGTTA